MKPLKVAVIHSYHREQTSERMHGAWSYPVPEFTWQRAKVSDGYTIDRADYADYDFVLIEDSHALGTIVGEGTPVGYWVGDSVISEWHYDIRHTQAGGADLILLTQDNLERFTDIGKPVRRWMMCIDENLFHTGYGEKTTDVGYFFVGNTKRRYRPYVTARDININRAGVMEQSIQRVSPDVASTSTCLIIPVIFPIVFYRRWRVGLVY